MIHNILKSFVIAILVFFSVSAAVAQEDGNGGGAVRISFGNGDVVEPITLSGDDPAVPSKPKPVFHTNSMVLNQILADCDEFEHVRQTLAQLQSSGQISLPEDADCPDCFLIVNNFSTGMVVAVLDKGKGKRMNLLNNQFETDAMYEGDEFKKLRFSLVE